MSTDINFGIRIFKGDSRYYEKSDLVLSEDLDKPLGSHDMYGCRKCGTSYMTKAGFGLGERKLFPDCNYAGSLCDSLDHSLGDLIYLGNCDQIKINSERTSLRPDEEHLSSVNGGNPIKAGEPGWAAENHKALQVARKKYLLEAIVYNCFEGNFKKYMQHLEKLCGTQLTADEKTVILDEHIVLSQTPMIDMYMFRSITGDNERLDQLVNAVLSTYEGWNLVGVDTSFLQMVLDYSIANCKEFPSVLGSETLLIIFKHYASERTGSSKSMQEF